MRRFRFLFTIGPLPGLVALAAVLALVLARFPGMIGLACTVAAVGFLVDRIKGRSGVVGAMRCSARSGSRPSGWCGIPSSLAFACSHREWGG